MIPDSLKLNAFPLAVWKETVPLQKQLDDRKREGVSEELDEYQFYVMRVGYSLAQIMTWMEQLDEAVYYLSDFSYRKEAKEEGVNRAKHLLYNVENYLIRLQSVYDRALQLTNNVFHLGIEESNVGHSVIISNIKVSRTDVVGQLKAVKKEVERRAQERHAIVHRESHRDEDLRRLQLFYMFQKDTWNVKPDGDTFDDLCRTRSQLLKTVVVEKKQEFTELNQAVFKKIEALFFCLHSQYDKECARLRLYVYGKSA